MPPPFPPDYPPLPEEEMEMSSEEESEYESGDDEDKERWGDDRVQHKHCLIVLHLIIANGHAGVLTYYSSVLIFPEKRLVANVCGDFHICISLPVIFSKYAESSCRSTIV